MNSTAMILIALAIYAAGYLFYGRTIAREVVRIDVKRETPAHKLYDGVDYVPGRWPVVFGHHFASIAGAGPIVGPLVAMAWGWLPCIIWIWAGNLFIGAVHDFLALMSSVRYDGKSMGWAAGELMTRRASVVFTIFVWMAAVLIIAAFVNVVIGLFMGTPAVATASLLFIAIALLIGYLMYKTKLSFWGVTGIGLALLAAAIVGSLSIPLSLPKEAWMVIIFIYILVAASLPVTMLLQPRDYLNAYILVFGLAIGAIAFIGLNAPLTWPAATYFSAHTIGGQPSPFYPTVPLVIACGALSGFHSIVAAGTTSKMIDTEAHALRIGYGGMLAEGLLSTIVVASLAVFGLQVAGVTAAEVGAAGFKALGLPIFTQSYALAVNKVLAIPVAVGGLFAALWVCAFCLTTLDTTNRLARFAWSDLLSRAVQTEAGRRRPAYRFWTHVWVGGILAAGLAIWMSTTGTFSAIWAAFGGANQMLAALALMVSAAWVTKVARAGKWRYAALIPAIFLWITNVGALIWYLSAMGGVAHPVTMAFVAILLVLAFYLLYEFIICLRGGPATSKSSA